MGKPPTLLVAGNLAGAAGRGRADTVPIDYITDWLKRRMPEFGGPRPKSLADRVLIVKSETGSGKSTVLPAYVLRLLRAQATPEAQRLQRAGVMCTQPRVLTAITLARDMAADDENYPDLVLGATVGYQTGSVNERPRHGLIYATSPSLLAQLRTTPDAELMAQYRFIIVDEAHERSLGLDALLMRLKAFLTRNLGNPQLPFVLLASATLPVAKYASYFGLGPANIVEITGRSYPIEYRFPETGTNDYPAEAARVAVRIHVENADDDVARADVLIFMPGAAEIKAVVEALTEANRAFRRAESDVPPFDVLTLNREEVMMQGRDFMKMTVDPARLRIPSLDGKEMLRPSRRIIVSTVVAETGLTIETLGYVVDGGWNRAMETYFPGSFVGTITRPAPKSRSKQRAGRSGRKFPGVYYPLYTKNVYNELPDEQLPDIVSEGVAPIFLDIVAAGAAAGPFRVEDIDMLDPPPVDALAAALEQAIAFGFLRPARAGGAVVGHELTALGELAGSFHRLSMPQAQLILAGYLWQVSIQDLALVAALYDARDAMIYPRPGPGVDAAAARRKALAAGLPPFVAGGRAPEEAGALGRLLLLDDFLEALLAFGAFARALDTTRGDLGALIDWCERHGFEFEGAVALAAARDEIIGELVAVGLNPFWGARWRLARAGAADFRDVVVRLKHCIYAAFRFSTLELGGGGRYFAAGRRAVEVPPLFDAGTTAILARLGVPDVPRPRLLVTNEVRVRGAPRASKDRYPPLLYRVVPGLVSVLDGFVAVDPAALAPRVRGGAV